MTVRTVVIHEIRDFLIFLALYAVTTTVICAITGCCKTEIKEDITNFLSETYRLALLPVND